MTNIAVIILTKNEKLHIGRCLKKLASLVAKQIFVVDCFSDDGTQEIAKQNGAIVVEHEWPGIHAKQFNWALDNLTIQTKWVLRMDADEYLTDETIEHLKSDLESLPNDITGLKIELKRKFQGEEIRHGTTGIRLARIFRFGIGRCEDKAMDEHIVVTQGRIIDYDGAFYDDSLMPFEAWKEKHRGYAKREARMAVTGKMNKNKVVYYKLPPYFRAFFYFCIRYFLKLGFLDGLVGFRWHFWQGLWYRCLVDREIGRMKRGNELKSEAHSG